MTLHALILVEGETEEEFYKALSARYLVGVPKTFKLMRGNFGINEKIVDRIDEFSQANPGATFDVYLCLDRDRGGMPVYNQRYVLGEIAGIVNCENVFDVIAEIMIESLFFIDIDGLYGHLRTKKAKRNPGKYRNFRRLTHNELRILFRQNSKIYHKGHRCRSLVDALDLEIIKNGAAEISFFVESILQRHEDCN